MDIAGIVSCSVILAWTLYRVRKKYPNVDMSMIWVIFAAIFSGLMLCLSVRLNRTDLGLPPFYWLAIFKIATETGFVASRMNDLDKARNWLGVCLAFTFVLWLAFNRTYFEPAGVGLFLVYVMLYELRLEFVTSRKWRTLFDISFEAAIFVLFLVLDMIFRAVFDYPNETYATASVFTYSIALIFLI